MQLEELIEEIKPFGRFQLMIILVLYTPKLLISWSMLVMSFAGVTPDWWCVPVQKGQSVMVDIDNMTLYSDVYKQCHTNATHCTRVYGGNMVTVVSKWDLVCDRSSIPPTITSIQMGGVLVGALVSGQSADVIGRKITYYTGYLLHGIANIIAAFSTSWEMFAVMRFFIGAMIGCYLVSFYPYTIEFIGRKHRSIATALQFWIGGVCLMAMTAWLEPNWKNVHLICGCLHFPFMFGWFIMPESVRWLATKGRLKEAEHVIDRMCSWNNRPKPKNCSEILKAVAEEEQRTREDGKKYTYLDVFRGWNMLKKTVIVNFVWASLSLVYYGLSFGVETLTGSLYLNIFLLAIVEVPSAIATYFLNNIFGRRKTAFSFLVLAAVSSIGVIIISFPVSKADQGRIVTALAIITKLGLGSAWRSFQLLSGESYPTVIRNIGYGLANTSARVGGILAPYLFKLNTTYLFIPYTIVASFVIACAISTLLMEDTNGEPLEDNLVESKFARGDKEDQPERYREVNKNSEKNATGVFTTKM